MGGTERQNSVHLGPVGGRQHRVGGTQEPTADGEPAEPPDLGDACLLQQRQRATARPNKHKSRVQPALLPCAPIDDVQCPAAVGLLAEIAHLMAEQGGRAALCRIADELSRQGPEVDVGAVRRPAKRHRLGEVTPGGHQGKPAGEFVLVVDELHRREQRIVDQRVVTALQVVDARRTVHEADMRNGVEETAHVRQQPVLDRIRPELPCHLELLVDLNRFVDVDRAVGPLRRVIQFAQPRVTGACVVPRVAALGGRAVQALDQRHRPVRLHLPQQCTERGGHDAGAHQHHVGLCGLRVRHESWALRGRAVRS